MFINFSNGVGRFEDLKDDHHIYPPCGKSYGIDTSFQYVCVLSMLKLKFSIVNGKSFITIHNNRTLPYIKSLGRIILQQSYTRGKKKITTSLSIVYIKSSQGT